MRLLLIIYVFKEIIEIMIAITDKTIDTRDTDF